ncbi:MAG: TolB family protein [Kofleriaceae bacterium]
MIRATLLFLVIAGCKDAPAKQPPSPAPAPVEAPAKPALVIESAAAALPGELWFTVEGESRRVIALAHGKARDIGTGSDEVFGALYPTAYRGKDGRVLGVTSFGDGRPDGERLVWIGANGSITTLGDPAMSVRDPALSPDGSWIVAAVQTEGVTNLVLFTVAGGQKPLTTDREGNFTPVAINKDTIAFVSSRDGDSEVYRMNVDGTKVQRLTAFHREDYEPAIDASGKQLAFTSDREQKVPRIFAVVPDGTGVRRLTQREDPKAEESQVVWSPKNTAHFAYTLKRDGHALVVAVNGSVEKVLTPPGANDMEVAFSPDGQWLVLVREHASHGTASHGTGASHGGHAHDHGGGASLAELVAYPLPAGSGEPIVIARGAIRVPRWFRE